MVESFVLVVCLVGVQDSGAGPALDGTRVHTELRGDLDLGEQSLGAEPLGVAGQVVAAACFEHDAGGERFAFAGAVTGGVEGFGGFGVTPATAYAPADSDAAASTGSSSSGSSSARKIASHFGHLIFLPGATASARRKIALHSGH